MQSLIVAFLLGLGSRLSVKIIGYMPLSEIAILLSLPLIVPQLTAARCLKPTRLLLPLAFLWLGFVIVTDVINMTSWALSARGIARVVMLIVCIPFFSWFMETDTMRKIACYIVGTIPSIILSAYVLRGGVHEGRELVEGAALINWETHWAAIPGSLAALGSAVLYGRLRLAAYAINAFVGVLNVYMGSRAAGAISVLGTALTIIRNILARKWGDMRKLTIARTLPAALLIGCVLYGIALVYGWAASTNQLGERARWKYEAQVRNRFGLLLGGRQEFVSGVLAVMDSPIIGFGSWPLDKQGYYLRTCELMNTKPDPGHYTRGYPSIPTHSHLMQAWVENGVGGAVFWIYVLYFVGMQSYRPMAHEKQLRLWATNAVVATVWVVLFSPISERLNMSLTLAVLGREMFAGGMAIRRPREIAGVALPANPRPTSKAG